MQISRKTLQVHVAGFFLDCGAPITRNSYDPKYVFHVTEQVIAARIKQDAQFLPCEWSFVFFGDSADYDQILVLRGVSVLMFLSS